MVTVKNILTTVVDIPGPGLIFQPGEEKVVNIITLPLAEAIQAGKIQVMAQEATGVVVVGVSAQTVFDLPGPWSGPDNIHLAVGGLIQAYGVDWSVDPETNEMTWLDAGVVLAEGDVLVFVGRWAS